jgi:hypothetical protein
MRKRQRLTEVINGLQAVSSHASCLDSGMQFKIADRVMGAYELSEEQALTGLLDVIITECMYARGDCDA